MDDAAGQRDFYNAAVAVRTTLEPQDLLRRCKAIERRLGRDRIRPATLLARSTLTCSSSATGR